MPEGRSDEALMTDYRLGEDQAFTVLYERHSGKILNYLRAKTSNEALARDVFQTTFLKLHATRARYTPGLPFLPWVFAICRNELIDTMRKRSRNLEDATEFVPDFPAPETADEPEVRLDSLPESQRTAVALRYQQDLPFEKIAERLSTSPANARQLVSRGVKALRRIYDRT